MSFQIITDSCCDLNQQQYETWNVRCVPLTVTYNGESHKNFSEAAAVKDFYAQLRNGTMASTAAANPEGWAQEMKLALENGQDVLALCFSSALSATYQSAVIAAEELKEEYPDRSIVVMDTLCAALGQGLLVHYACRLRDEGKSLEEVATWVEANKLHICHWVTVDDLSHLKRGGRISATTAIVGTMLNIKPIIYVNNEGKLINTAKARGRKAAMDYLTGKFAQTAMDMDTVFIGHGDCPEDAAALEAMLKEAGAKNVVTGYVGPVIGAHTGPGVLVLFFLGTQR